MFWLLHFCAGLSLLHQISLNYLFYNLEQFYRYLTLQQIKICSRLEEEFQLEIWGVVEGGHGLNFKRFSILFDIMPSNYLLFLLSSDMDRLAQSISLSSVGTFMHLHWDTETFDQHMDAWKEKCLKNWDGPN